MDTNMIVRAVQREFDGGRLGTPGKGFVYDDKISGYIAFLWDETIEDTDVKNKLESMNADVVAFGNGYATIKIEKK